MLRVAEHAASPARRGAAARRTRPRPTAPASAAADRDDFEASSGVKGEGAKVGVKSPADHCSVLVRPNLPLVELEQSVPEPSPLEPSAQTKPVCDFDSSYY